MADDALVIHDATGRSAALTHWSFEQLAGIAGGPPRYLRSLPAAIASDAINVGLRRHAANSTSCSRNGPTRGPSTR